MVDSDSIAALQAENARLVALLQSNGIDWRLPAEPEPIVTSEAEPSRFSTAEKVALFRRLDVVMSRVGAVEVEDPVMGQFLSFLARDFASHPERLSSINVELAGRIQSLVSGVKIDLDAPLSADDE